MHADVLGIPVHYEAVGVGRPILVLHGWGADHRFTVHHYEPLFASRSGWRRLYPDMPGMGTTPGADWIRSQADMLSVLSGFVDAVMPGERFVVIGVSWGGYMATGLARTVPERLDGIMLTALKLIAEGVETMEQRERLLELGCTLGQGYVFAHPLTPLEFDGQLATSALGVDGALDWIGARA